MSVFRRQKEKDLYVESIRESGVGLPLHLSPRSRTVVPLDPSLANRRSADDQTSTGDDPYISYEQQQQELLEAQIRKKHPLQVSVDTLKTTIQRFQERGRQLERDQEKYLKATKDNLSAGDREAAKKTLVMKKNIAKNIEWNKKNIELLTNQRVQTETLWNKVKIDLRIGKWKWIRPLVLEHLEGISHLDDLIEYAISEKKERDFIENLVESYQDDIQWLTFDYDDQDILDELERYLNEE